MPQNFSEGVTHDFILFAGSISADFVSYAKYVNYLLIVVGVQKQSIHSVSHNYT